MVGFFHFRALRDENLFRFDEQRRSAAEHRVARELTLPWVSVSQSCLVSESGAIFACIQLRSVVTRKPWRTAETAPLWVRDGVSMHLDEKSWLPLINEQSLSHDSSWQFMVAFRVHQNELIHGTRMMEPNEPTLRIHAPAPATTAASGCPIPLQRTAGGRETPCPHHKH